MSIYDTAISTPDRLISGTEADLVPVPVTILSGEGVVPRGAILGAVLFGAVAAVASGGNVGNPTFSAFTRKATVKQGAYTLSITQLGGAVAAGAATHAGSTGDGVVTYTGISQNAKVGNYRAVCTAVAANAGTFTVYDPDGEYVGTATVGVAYNDGTLQFTIADGATDWALNDTVLFPVAYTSDTSKFSVVDPNGDRLADGSIGTAYADELGFTMTGGATHTAVGDTWTVTVAAPTLDANARPKLRLVNSANTDGSGVGYAVLATPGGVDATSADAVGIAYVGGMFDINAVTVGGADTAAQHQTELEAKKIFLTSSSKAIFV